MTHPDATFTRTAAALVAANDRVPEQRAGEEIDPLALALFGIRDHIRHHLECLDKRGIGGHHFDAADECALADIVKRYGDQRAAFRAMESA